VAATGEHEYLLGIDVGGTHTDLCLAAGSRLYRSKALTTHHDYSEGILEAISVVAKSLSLSVGELVSRSRALVNGTTIVTNAVTEVRGARVGVLVNAGFPDTFRLVAGARRNVYDDHAQVDPPEIVPKDCIEEIEERVGRDGSVLVPLDEEAVRRAVRRLKAKGVATIAVCFLWSFKHPAHESRAREIIHEEWPEVFVTLSSEIHPVIREYERFLTAVFNCFCQPAAVRLLDTLGQRLELHGFAGKLTFFSGAGGAISAELAKRFPILLLASGPAGGVIGATQIAELLGESNVMTGDMGGTSFDASLVEGARVAVTPSVKIDEFDTGITLIDVISVGAGGGSIAWIDDRGVPQVGPKSAGSSPGPVCYGRGGTEPTVTDASVVLGYIDPGGYLDGRVQLDRAAAESALVGRFGGRYGWTAQQAAEGIAELTCTNMAHALRQVSVERGHDPRHFLMLAYGGTLPMFVTRICDKLGMTSVVVPYNSSVFSAFGVLTADYVRRYSQTVEWDLKDHEDHARVNQRRQDLLERARAEAAVDGFAPEQCRLEWVGEFRFQGQVYEVPMPLPDRPFSGDDAVTLAEEFPAHYERMYGKGTAWKASKVLLLTLGLIVTAARPKPTMTRLAEEPGDASAAIVGERLVYSAALGAYEGVAVYLEDRFRPGMRAEGPGIIDQRDTTIVVPRGWAVSRDGYLNFVLRKTAGEKA
jgi:N-methylhydantoinase A